MDGMARTSSPYRWDLVTPDQLGTLLAGQPEPELPFADELTVAAAKVVARSGGGELFFVGRSPDSVFDLLSGAFSGTDHEARLHRLPFSGRFGLTGADRANTRGILGEAGLTPQSLARGHRPVALVDLVAEGGTFGNLFQVLRDWIADEREAWSVIRRKLRFAGITARRPTSPNTWRWQQAADWPAQLPARNVTSVSIDERLWHYLAGQQIKLTRSFTPSQWTSDEPAGPRHDEHTRTALAEAVALVALGRQRRTRSLVARTIAGEPAYAESWSRTLIGQLG